MAVALQDHLARQYSLSLTAPLPNRRLQQPTAALPSSLTCYKCGIQPHHYKKLHQHRKTRQVLAINSDMLSLNTNSDSRETVRPCAGQQNRQPCKISSTSRSEVEYVLDKSPPALTLAQRMGLVEAPPALLSNAEWKELKSMSNHRHDSSLPCPICHEPFGLSQQVNHH